MWKFSGWWALVDKYQVSPTSYQHFAAMLLDFNQPFFSLCAVHGVLHRPHRHPCAHGPRGLVGEEVQVSSRQFLGCRGQGRPSQTASRLAVWELLH